MNGSGSEFSNPPVFELAALPFALPATQNEELPHKKVWSGSGLRTQDRLNKGGRPALCFTDCSSMSYSHIYS